MKFNKNLKGFICMALALIMIFGSTFAYFTDRATTSASGTAGTVGIDLVSDINLLDEDGKDILNPGDLRDGSFSVENTGNKSIDVRTTIVLTSSVPMTTDENGQAEYELYLRDDVHFVEGEGWKPNDGAKPVEVRSISEDGKTITYKVPDYVLNGNEDFGDDNREIEDGVDTDIHDNDFVLIFAGSQSGNDFQGSTVKIDVLVEAKQHRNTEAGWEVVAQETINNDSIPVIAKDTDGNETQASAEKIKGSEEEALIKDLIENGLIGSEDFTIIEIKSDNYDNLGEIVIDLSEVAEPYEDLVIVHKNQETGEYEFLMVEFVRENGTLDTDISWFTPIPIIPSTDNGGNEDPGTGTDDEIVGPDTYILFDEDMNGIYTWGELSAMGAIQTHTETVSTGPVVKAMYIDYIDSSIIDEGDILIIPEEVSNMEVVQMAAINNTTRLQKIELPNTVTSFVNNTSSGLFAMNYSLTEIILPETINEDTIDPNEFYDRMFSNCMNLEEIVLPEGITVIGECMFEYCENTRRIVLPSTIREIQMMAFESNNGMRDTTIEMPEYIDIVDDTAFRTFEGFITTY